MLEGITVLNEITVYGDTFNLIACIITIVVVCGLFILGAILDGHDIVVDCLAGLTVGWIFGLLFGGLVGTLAGLDRAPEIDYIKYQVTIDESVSFTEFNEKYKIIDQDGAIYTIKEREK